MSEARYFVVRGTVQGVGFRPFVARLADLHQLAGWVLNAPHGVEIHVEGRPSSIEAFAIALCAEAPPFAAIAAVDESPVPATGAHRFEIRESEQRGVRTVRIPPDLPICADCLAEMRDPAARRFRYPYINCTRCGPRFSIVRDLPYDRARTTMAAWPLCEACAAEYQNPADRRFHAEPVACSACGPGYHLLHDGRRLAAGDAAIAAVVERLEAGGIVGIKGIGGYHLCCDARNATTVQQLRLRKYRKAKPFALMARDLKAARALVHLDAAAESQLLSPARPIVLAPARAALAGVAPGHHELGVMLPYAPIHHLLFDGGAPDVLVMTSANRASEPIAFEDEDAITRLDGIADALLVGERPIARRVDDSVVRSRGESLTVLRRARGYAPAVVARVPAGGPILAMGADLKNTVAVAINGEVVLSQHVGDLEHAGAHDAFRTTVRDLLAIYGISSDAATVVHDAHPQYASSAYAQTLPARRRVAVQHHRAHVASVMAEHQALDTPVVGIAFDGTGFGDDGTIWGGEFFVGSVSGGFTRAAWLRPFDLPGGDAAARSPVQAAAGLLWQMDELPDLTLPPFGFGRRYIQATAVARAGVRTFRCTSAGRLFDAVAALLGFTADVDYEGQAAEWLEQMAWRSAGGEPLPVTVGDTEIDVRPALRRLVDCRRRGADTERLARGFHEALGAATADMAKRLCDAHGISLAAVSGGTFQNALLLDVIREQLPASVALLTNRIVPPNDGGIAVGQAALAAAAER